jgi:hypothetical protein
MNLKKLKIGQTVIAEKLDKNKWANFAKETLTHDAQGGEKLDFKEFGELMQKVHDHSGEIESVLWAGANPSGTEDRTWVRAWAGLKGVPAYKGIASGPDGGHAKRILEQFKAVGFKG